MINFVVPAKTKREPGPIPRDSSIRQSSRRLLSQRTTVVMGPRFRGRQVNSGRGRPIFHPRRCAGGQRHPTRSPKTTPGSKANPLISDRRGRRADRSGPFGRAAVVPAVSPARRSRVSARCRCARNVRVRARRSPRCSRSFAPKDRADMVKDGKVVVTCEFCSSVYQFAPQEAGDVGKAGLCRADEAQQKGMRRAEYKVPTHVIFPGGG